MGSIQDHYSVPAEAEKVLQSGIVKNDLIAKDLPPETIKCVHNVRFTSTTNEPVIPINWRFAESAAALKGLEASIIGALLKRKYGIDIGEIEIDTDHAQLFFMSTLLYTIDPNGEAINMANQHKIFKYIKDCDKHNSLSSQYRRSATNIYKTKDGRYFHLHGSLNPDPSLDSLGLPHDMPTANGSDEESWKPFMDKMATIDSQDMQTRASDVYRQAGQICLSTTEFRESEHGKANAHVGLWEIHASPTSKQEPSWWPPSPQTSPSRPLAGLKVVDLTRIIAAPAVTRSLAELGASVMRVVSPNITDYAQLHVDLNWGKWNSYLDLKNPEDREKLHTLIQEADVVVQGYRPGVLDKYGFSQQDIIDMCAHRERGIISVRENCYGWNGPWSYRSGWQQISDACVGISMEFGRAMGHTDGEAVTPVFPNSDYMTGTAGSCAIILALMRRAEEGGSFKVDVALNYYNQWLANSVGTYPDHVWQELWAKNGKPVFRSYHNMGYTIPRVMKMVMQNSPNTILKPEYFEDRYSGVFGVDVRTIKPILKFKNGEVDLKYNVGTRGNGVDEPRWPNDLMTEVVK